MPGNSELIDLSIWHIFLSMSPLILVALASYSMGLQLESPVLVASIRTFVQLSLLALILQPIFVWGEEYWEIVVVYAFFMILVASYESVQRSKYYFRYMYPCLLGCFLFNATLVSFFSFGVVIQPKPVWDPQYVIPLLGMMLGNAINGASISLKSILSSLVEDSAEIELLLSFGASSTEASNRLLREAVRTGALPMLNSMSVIGLISIPGMMTGQILGGSDVMEAARYQMMVMYLLSVCTFGTILCEVFIALRVGFDFERDMLRTDRFHKREERRSFFELVAHVFAFLTGRSKKRANSYDLSSGEVDALYVPSGTSAYGGTLQSKLRIHTLQQTQQLGTGLGDDFQAANLTCSFKGKDDERRGIFESISFRFSAGEIAHVSGPSGAGKSTLLRLLAGLTPMDSGDIRLGSTRQTSHDHGFTAWRREVRYVTQYKVSIPGTPIDFCRSITAFRTWQQSNSKEGMASSLKDLLLTCRELLANWGMDASDLENKKWSQLSGGEAQRVLVAVALASKPRVLLMDESTSALDLETKIRVENSVKEYAFKYGMSVLWVTHDLEQIERMKILR